MDGPFHRPRPDRVLCATRWQRPRRRPPRAGWLRRRATPLPPGTPPTLPSLTPDHPLGLKRYAVAGAKSIRSAEREKVRACRAPKHERESVKGYEKSPDPVPIPFSASRFHLKGLGELSRVRRGLGNGMPTACPWEFHVRRYTGGHPQPATPFPSGGGAAAGERGGGDEERFVCSTERKYPADKPWAFIRPSAARTAQGRAQGLSCKSDTCFSNDAHKKAGQPRTKTDRRPANWWDCINFGHGGRAAHFPPHVGRLRTGQVPGLRCQRPVPRLARLARWRPRLRGPVGGQLPRFARGAK